MSSEVEFLKEEYIEIFESEPDRCFSCGGRFEILGNHTDHNHGLCLASACNLRIIVATAKNKTDVVKFQSLGYELDEVNLDDDEPKEIEYATSKGLIRGVATYLKKQGYNVGGFNAYSRSTIFKGAGVSSSAAFEVLVGHIFNELFNDGKIPKIELCKAGKFAENLYFGKKSGLLDQIGVAYGGVVKIDFRDVDQPVVEQTVFPFTDLHFVLVNTGGDHSSLSDLYSSIPSDMYEAARVCGHNYLAECTREELEAFKFELNELTYNRAVHFFEENKRVCEAFDAIANDDQERFLELINESRESSAKLLKNMMVDNEYKGSPLEACDLLMKACDNKGAVKINGGGFAGSVIALVPTDKLEAVLEKMKKHYGEYNVREIFIRAFGPVEEQ